MLSKSPVCPCCGQTCDGTRQGVAVDVRTGATFLGDRKMFLPRVESLIMDALAKEFPGGLSIQQTHFAAYGNRVDGGPDVGSVWSHVSRMKRKLREAGWPVTIISARYIGYRLSFEE